MARFDWIPYLKGKYLSYYEWFGFIGSYVALNLSVLSFVLYLILCKIEIHQTKYKFLSWVAGNSPIINRLKSLTFNGGFVFLSLIPLFCQALDIIDLIEGILGQLTILVIGVFMDNGRIQWNNDNILLSTGTNTPRNNFIPMLKEYLSLCLKLTRSSKKRIITCAIVTILVNILMFRTCLCFYNS